MSLTINTFLNKGSEVGEKVKANKGVQKAGNAVKKAGSSLLSIAPAPVRMVRRVEEESLDRDIEINGNLHILFDAINELRSELGLAPAEPLTEEETVQYIKDTRSYLNAKKKEAKEVKKAQKKVEKADIKNLKLLEYMLGGAEVDEEELIDEDEIIEEEYDEEPEEEEVVEEPQKPTRKLPGGMFDDASKSKYDYSDMGDM